MAMSPSIPFWTLHARPRFVENAAVTLGMLGAALAVAGRILGVA